MTTSRSHKIPLRKGLFFSAMLFSGLFFFSCREDGEVVPEFNTGELNVLIDTIEVNSVTIPGDSVRSDETTRNVFGKLNEKTLGLSSADFFTQIALSASSLNLGDITAFDSIVLELAYDNYYGFDYTQTMEVYEITEDLDPEIPYYGSSVVATKDELLGSTKITVNANDTFADSAFTVRMRLADELGQRILEQREFVDNNAWLDFFKGIRVKPADDEVPQNTGEGAVIYFNLLNVKTRMVIYYQSEGITQEIEFFPLGNSARFSHFSYDYSGSDVENLWDKEGEAINYLGALGGPRMRLNLLDIDRFQSELPIAVNRAELIFSYEDPSIPEFTEPDRIVVLIERNGSFVLPKDFEVGGIDFYGGAVDRASQEYRFNLASTVHDIINNGKTDESLYVTVSGNAVTANRIALNSGQHPNRKIFLILTYTKSG